MTARTSFTDIYDASARYHRQQGQKLALACGCLGVIAGFVLGVML